MQKGNPGLSMLGIARKSGRLSVGFDAVVAAIKRGKSRLVVVASDISEKTEKELRYHAENKKTEVIRISEDIFTVSNAIGTKAGVISVDDEGLAAAIQKRFEIKEEISL